MSMSDRDGVIWYDGKMVPWREANTHVLTHTLHYTYDEGAVTSFLEVRESNLAAQEMYRKFGYEKTGRRKRYYKDNDEDAILMTLSPLNVESLKSDV